MRRMWPARRPRDTSDRRLRSPLMQAMAKRNATALLTPRQREVATLISWGLTNAEIAERLVMDVSTVNNHVVHIMARLGFHRRAQLAAWVVERGLHRHEPRQTESGGFSSTRPPGFLDSAEGQ